ANWNWNPRLALVIDAALFVDFRRSAVHPQQALVIRDWHDRAASHRKAVYIVSLRIECEKPPRRFIFKGEHFEVRNALQRVRKPFTLRIKEWRTLVENDSLRQPEVRIPE